ncbi:hypothetical protein KCP70_14990 [Salmonella enterica subsp. enterica]|nr:hypothetical protein KCP70_14990 [Salmonella enterica subsp. enterica]
MPKPTATAWLAHTFDEVKRQAWRAAAGSVVRTGLLLFLPSSSAVNENASMKRPKPAQRCSGDSGKRLYHPFRQSNEGPAR